MQGSQYLDAMVMPSGEDLTIRAGTHLVYQVQKAHPHGSAGFFTNRPA